MHFNNYIKSHNGHIMALDYIYGYVVAVWSSSFFTALLFGWYQKTVVKTKLGFFFSFPVSVFSCFFPVFLLFFFQFFFFLYKSWPLPLRTQDEESGGPTASFPVVLGNFGCDVTCQACRENSPYRTRFQASSWIVRPGLGTRLDLLLFPLTLPPFGCVCNKAYYIW